MAVLEIKKPKSGDEISAGKKVKIKAEISETDAYGDVRASIQLEKKVIGPRGDVSWQTIVASAVEFKIT